MLPGCAKEVSLELLPSRAPKRELSLARPLVLLRPVTRQGFSVQEKYQTLRVVLKYCKGAGIYAAIENQYSILWSSWGIYPDNILVRV